MSTVSPQPLRSASTGPGYVCRKTCDRDRGEPTSSCLAGPLPGLLSLPIRGCGMHDAAPVRLCDAPAVRRAAFAGHVPAVEVMAVRPEDIDARQDQRAFAAGATLAELEQYIAFLRSLGAPDDAHPKIGVSDDYEVTMMICVVERAAVQLSDAS